MGYLGYYLPVFLLALVGSWVVGRDRAGPRHAVVLLWMMMGALAVAQSLFYVEGRHRWAIEPLLIVLAVVAVAQVRRLVSASPLAVIPADAPGTR